MASDFLSNLLLGGLQSGRERAKLREEEESQARGFAVEQLLRQKFPSVADMTMLAVLKQLGLNIPGAPSIGAGTTAPPTDVGTTIPQASSDGGFGVTSFSRGGVHLSRPKSKAIPALERRRLEDLDDQLLTVQSGQHPFKAFILPRLNELLDQKSRILDRLKQGNFDVSEFEQLHTDPKTDPVVRMGTHRRTGERIVVTRSGKRFTIPQDATTR